MKAVPIGKKSQGKVPINEIYSQIANTIIGNSAANRLGFDGSFRVYEPSPGIREVVTIAPDEVVTVVNPETIVAEIMAYGQKLKNVMPEYCLSHAQALEAMKVWRSLAPPIPKPQVIRWQSEPGTCWRRVPFDPMDNLENLPTWESLIAKIDDKDARDAVLCWIGSLFVPGSYRQQYVWIYGGGGNGKGAIARFLQKIFGSASHFISHVPREPNQFFTSQLLNKRLVILPDCENYSFPASGLFKTLSGGDPINIEKKGRDPYTEILDIMFFFTSNQLPNISSGRSDMRRAIFARMEDGGQWAPDFEEKLWDEGGGFIHHCMAMHAYHCPTGGPVPVANVELKEWVSTLEEPMEEAFSEHFALSPDGYTLPREMQATVNALWDRRGQQLAFMKWMERTHGVRKKNHRLQEGVIQHRYPGVVIKKKAIKRGWNDAEHYTSDVAGNEGV